MTNKEKIEYQQKIRDSFEFDLLRMYFAYDHVTSGGISIKQPSIKDILDFGEKRFYSALNVFTSNPTQYRLPLWDLGVDWNKTNDYELFCMLYQGVDSEISKFLFNEVDFKDFKLFSRVVQKEEQEEDGNSEEETELVLYHPELELLIDCKEYLEISQYLRVCYNIFPKTERAKGKATKEAIIWEDREKAKKEKEDEGSLLLPLISSCVNHPGFKYKPNELKEVKIYEFMDSVQRLQVYESTVALMGGMYSGFCDTSKIPKENFNFMRDLSGK